MLWHMYSIYLGKRQWNHNASNARHDAEDKKKKKKKKKGKEEKFREVCMPSLT